MIKFVPPIVIFIATVYGESVTFGLIRALKAEK